MASPELVYRDEKGSELTSPEADKNLRDIVAYVEGIEQRVDGVLSADGALLSPDVLYGTVAGTATAYTVTVGGTFSAASELIGKLIVLRIPPSPDLTCGNSPTLNVNSLGVKNIVKRGSLLAVTWGDMRGGGHHVVTYDGTSFQLIDPVTTPRINFGSDSETTVNTYKVDIGSPPGSGFEFPAAYYAGYTVTVKIRTSNTPDNTGAATLQIVSGATSLAAVAIRRNNAALVGNEIRSGQTYTFVHDGTYFQMAGGSNALPLAGDGYYSGTSASAISTAVHTFTHGLGAVPRNVRVVLVKDAVDAEAAGTTYTLNDEVEIWTVRASGNNCNFAVAINATTIVVAGVDTAGLTLPPKTGGSAGNMNEASWKPKVYAWL